MQPKSSLKTNIRSSIQAKREEIDLATVSLTKESYLRDDQPLPLVIQPSIEGVNLASWASNNRDYLSRELAKHGGILFRNFSIDSPAKFEAFARAVSSELFAEYGDLPREDAGQKVYSSTPYPNDKAILFHNESSHMHRWPMKIWFYCVKVAEVGGATPIIDCRKLYQKLDPKIIARLTEKKLLYVRNFIDGLDVSWQQFFHFSQRSFQNYTTALRRGTKNWYEFISVYYRLNVLFTAFIQDPRYRLDVLKLLQGDVYDEEAPVVLQQMKEIVSSVERNENHLWHRQLGELTTSAFSPSF